MMVAITNRSWLLQLFNKRVYILALGSFTHISYIQKWLIWFSAVFWFYSLMTVPCGSKHGGMFSMIL